MKGFVRVFAFELKDKRAILAAALFAGLMVFPLAWGVHAASGFGFGESRDAAAFTLALACGLGLAVLFGATVLGRDLSENRLGFFLSRPITGLGLWAGKMGAALTLTLAAGIITLLPATLAGGGLLRVAPVGNPFFLWNWGGDTLSPWFPALVCLFSVTLVLAAAHALSIMVRSRSPLLLLDAALAGAAGLLAAVLYRRLDFWEAYPVLLLLFPVFLLVLLVALLAAGAVQVAAGRSDLRRGHAMLSLTLWPVLFGGLFAGILYARWYVSVSPSDLKAVTQAEAAPEGPWVSIGGVAEHRGPYAQPGFLLNVQTGNWVRVGWRYWGPSPVFSPEGKYAAWTQWPHLRGGVRPELVAADLTGAEPKLIRPAIQGSTAMIGRLFFSPDGARLALLNETELTLFRFPSFDQVGAVKLPPPPPRCDARWSGRFAGSDRILLYQRIYSGKPTEGIPTLLRLYAFDAASRKLEATGSVPSYLGTLFWVSPDGGRLLTRTREGGKVGVTLRDGRTGDALKEMAGGWDAAWPAFLSDGKIVVAGRNGDEASASLFSSEGQELKTWPLGRRISAAFVGEPLPGALLFMIKPLQERSWLLAKPCLLDLGNGKVTELQDLHSASYPWWSEDSRLGRYPASGQGGLFLDGKSRLVRYDFAKGEKRVIVKTAG